MGDTVKRMMDEEPPAQLLEAGIYTGETIHLSLNEEQKLELEIENERHTGQYCLMGGNWETGFSGSEEILLPYEEARAIVLARHTKDYMDWST